MWRTDIAQDKLLHAALRHCLYDLLFLFYCNYLLMILNKKCLVLNIRPNRELIICFIPSDTVEA